MFQRNGFSIERAAAIVLILTSSALLASCSLSKGNAADPASPAAAATTSQKVIQNVSGSIILQTYKNLRDSTATLRERSSELRRAPSQAALDGAGQAWRDARRSWEQTEAFLFGPVESLGIDAQIDRWPVQIGELNAILTKSEAITPASVRTFGTNLKGFHTAEYLLFGDGAGTNQKKIEAMTDREREYLEATAIVLAEDTAKLANAWEFNWNPDDAATPGYITVIENPGSQNAAGYLNESNVIAEMVNGMEAIAKEVGTGKIATPLGVDKSHADPEAEESPFSWNSTEDFANNIRSIRLVFTGETPGGTGFGVMKLVAERDPALATDVLKQIDLAIAKIEAIGGSDGATPFRQAILDDQTGGRARVQTAQAEVIRLYDMIHLRLQAFFQGN